VFRIRSKIIRIRNTSFVCCDQDGKIRGYLPDVEDPLFILEGHTENVSSLYASKFGTIISGTRDRQCCGFWMILSRIRLHFITANL
jgi:hypothetical protein